MTMRQLLAVALCTGLLGVTSHSSAQQLKNVVGQEGLTLVGKTCTGTFHVELPKGGNADQGAMRFTFSSEGNSLTVRQESEWGMAAFRNPPTRKLERQGDIAEVRMNGPALRIVGKSGVVYDLVLSGAALEGWVDPTKVPGTNLTQKGRIKTVCS